MGEDILMTVYNQSFKPKLPPQAIRIITTGSMLRRFSIEEEVAITTGADETAKVIRQRLVTSPYADLDFKDLQEGVYYIVNYLDTINSIKDNVTVEERLAVLLADGTKFEKYQGAL